MRKDKEATKVYHRQWYQKNKQKVAAKTKANRQHLRTKLAEYKSTLKCQLCPEDDPCCLDFHHTDDNKEHNISQMPSSSYAWKTILAEIQKCAVLCKNCHAKVHAEHASIV